MSKAFRITVSLMLSCLILVSGSGLIIGKMVCLRSGYTVIVPQKMEDCCKTVDDCCEEGTAPAFAFEGECCDVKNLAFEAYDFTPGSDISLKVPSPLTLFFIPATRNGNTAFAAHTPLYAHPPHPLISAGPGELSFLGVYRI
jgi:hypothetical protein